MLPGAGWLRSYRAGGSGKALSPYGSSRRRWRIHLEAHDIADLRLRDHRVSQSIYLSDPDGNHLELYVDADPSVWREDPAAVATSVRLEL